MSITFQIKNFFIKILTFINIFKIDLFEIMLKLSFFLTGRNRVYYNTKHEFETILRFIDKINIFIDIGANQGFYSDLVLKNNDNANIFLIEPNKKNFNFLKKKYLNKDNIKALNIALGSNNKNKYFYSSYASGLDSVCNRKFQLDHKIKSSSSPKFINFKNVILLNYLHSKICIN